MYIGIASSGVIWEEKKKSRYFKQMKIQEVQILEERYQQYSRNKQVGIDEHHLYFDAAGKIPIDFDHMVLKKSHPREIRRTEYPGLWISMKSSPYQLQLHAKINRIQIDNQLTDCIFPVVLAPVAPPKSVAASIGTYSIAIGSAFLFFSEKKNVNTNSEKNPTIDMLNNETIYLIDRAQTVC